MMALPPFARVRTAPALAPRMWTPRRRSRSSLPTTPLNTAGPPVARFVSSPRAARSSSTAPPTNTSEYSLQCKHVAAQCGPDDHRRHSSDSLQPVRIQHRRPFLHSQPLQYGQDQSLLVLGRGMGQVHFHGFEQYRQRRRADRSTLKMRTGDFSELLDPNNPFVTRTVTNPADPAKTRSRFPLT